MELLQAVGAILIERSAFFLQLTIEHLWISAAAIGIAILVGGLAGIAISQYDAAAKPTLGMVNFLYTIPSISMLGFLIPFFGVGNRSAIIALTIYALLPMVRATHTGLTHIHPALIEAAVGMGGTAFQVLTRIKIPLAMPVIMSGIRSMATMTIALAGIASFIGAGGLGVAIYRGITTNHAALTIAGSILIAALALIVDMGIGRIEQGLTRRRSADKSTRIVCAAAFGAALFAVGSIILGGAGQGNVVRIATKPMTEQLIIGEMLKCVIEHDTNLEVMLTAGVGGGTSNIHPAMERGVFDIYPEYTGTGWNMVLKEDAQYSEDMFPLLMETYRERFRMRWLGMYGFNDTFGIVVRRDIAEQYHLQTYSDLRRAASVLVFGAEYDFFEREDGYTALCKAYGLSFARTMDMDIGLKYQAFARSEVDVMTVFTTDGQLAAADAVMLADDRQFFPSYRCGNVVREEILAVHPELTETLEKLTGIISDAEMAKMNYAVETNGEDPHSVAEAFLRTKGVL